MNIEGYWESWFWLGTWIYLLSFDEDTLFYQWYWKCTSHMLQLLYTRALSQYCIKPMDYGITVGGCGQREWSNPLPNPEMQQILYNYTYFGSWKEVGKTTCIILWHHCMWMYGGHHARLWGRTQVVPTCIIILIILTVTIVWVEHQPQAAVWHAQWCGDKINGVRCTCVYMCNIYMRPPPASSGLLNVLYRVIYIPTWHDIMLYRVMQTCPLPTFEVHVSLQLSKVIISACFPTHPISRWGYYGD